MLHYAREMLGRGTAASGPTATPHRYWRIWIGTNSGDTSSSGLVVSAAEVELREAVGGADVTGSGTASADSSTGGFSAGGAFADDGVTTEWASAASAYPHWLKYDFGSGVTKAIIEVGIRPRGSGNSPQCIGEFKIQSSDDNSTWADEWWVVYPGGSNGHSYVDGSFKSFTKPTLSQTTVANQHVYWRVSITGSNGGSFVGAREILMKSVSGSTDETQDGTPTSRSNFTGLTPAQAFDGMAIGQNTTEWASNNVGFPEWIQYQFPRAVEIREVTYKARVGLESSQAPSGIDFQYSDNGSSWTTIKSVTPASWTSFPQQTWTLP